MRKLITILILIIASINSFSQDVVGRRVIAKQSLFLNGTWYTSIPTNTDSLFGVQDNLMAANRTVNMNGKYER